MRFTISRNPTCSCALDLREADRLWITGSDPKILEFAGALNAEDPVDVMAALRRLIADTRDYSFVLHDVFMRPPEPIIDPQRSLFEMLVS